MVLGNCKNAKSFRFYAKSDETAHIENMRDKTKHHTLCEASSPRGSIAVDENCTTKESQFQPGHAYAHSCLHWNKCNAIVRERCQHVLGCRGSSFIFRKSSEKISSG